MCGVGGCSSLGRRHSPGVICVGLQGAPAYSYPFWVNLDEQQSQSGRSEPREGADYLNDAEARLQDVGPTSEIQ